MTDLRYAVRQLLKQPVLAAVVLLSLGIGIGANTIVLTWIRTLVMEPIPGLNEPDRLVVVCSQHRTGGLGHTISEFDMQSLAEEPSLLSGITGSEMGSALMRIGEQKEWLWVEVPLANYFDVLGVKPILGNGFEMGDDAPSPPRNSIVISYQLWQRRFGGDASVIGNSVEINKQPATIVGVAPESFRGTMGGLGFDAWIAPALFDEQERLIERRETRSWRWAHAIARPAPGVEVDRARAGAASVIHRLAREFPESYADLEFAVLPLWKSPWGAQAFFLPLLQALGLAAGLLLLLVTANVAHLLLARSYQRELEMAIRVALGAPPRRIIRQLLTESLLLAVIGGLLGWLLATIGRDWIFALMPPTYLPFHVEFGFDGRVFTVILIITLMAGVAFGLAPAIQCARTNLQSALKDGARGVVRSNRQHLRTAFVVGEVALATVLLVGMGLCLRSLEKSRQVYVGLDPNNVVVAGFRIGPNDGDDAHVNDFYRRLRHEAADLPGVDAVGLGSWLPLGFEGGPSTWVGVEGYAPARGESMNVDISVVSPGYFEALHIPIKEGRAFEERDVAGQPPGVVINEEFARRYFPGRNPIGLKVRYWGREGTVVGVAANGKYRQLNEPQLPWLYVNQLQNTHRALTLVVRSGAPTPVLQHAVEQLTSRLDPTLAPVATLAYRDFVAAAWTVPRMAAWLLSVLGGIAWLLAVLGVYAVVSQQAVQRTREMAIRMALGAQPAEIFQTVLRGGFVLALSGLAIGSIVGLALSRTLGSILIGVGPGDWLAWLGMILVLLSAALLACCLPARYASRVDPMVALRSE
jgi:predicted permease